MPQNKEGKEVVFQSNEMVRMKTPLSLAEWQVLFMAQAQLHPYRCEQGDEYYPSDEERTIHLSADSVYNYFRQYGGSKHKSRHDLLSVVCESCVRMASNAVIEQRVSDGRISGVIVLNMFERISFDAKNGLFVTFTPSMIKYMLCFMDKFTQIPIEIPWVVSSPYSVKLLILLLSNSFHADMHEGRFWLKIEIDEYRELMGVPDGKYSRMDNFLAKVVDYPINDIIRKLNYRISYTKIRGSYNRVVALQFEVEILDWKPKLTSSKSDYEPLKSDEGQEKTPQGQTSPTAPHEPKPRKEKQEDPTTKYLSYVTLPREQDGLWGVSSRMAKKFIKALGWERCKLISDSMLPSLQAGTLDIPAAALVSAWKANKLYESHGVPVVNIDEPKEKPQAAKEKPIDMSNFFRP